MVNWPSKKRNPNPRVTIQINLNIASTYTQKILDERQVLDPRGGCPCNVDGGPGSSTEYIKFESFRTLRERSWDAITGVMVVTLKKLCE